MTVSTRLQLGFLPDGQPRKKLPHYFWGSIEWNSIPDIKQDEIVLECMPLYTLPRYLTNGKKNISITKCWAYGLYEKNRDSIPGFYKVERRIYIHRSVAKQIKEILENSPELIYSPPKTEIDEKQECIADSQADNLSERFTRQNERNREAFKRLRRELRELRAICESSKKTEESAWSLENRIAAIEDWLKKEFSYNGKPLNQGRVF